MLFHATQLQVMSGQSFSLVSAIISDIQYPLLFQIAGGWPCDQQAGEMSTEQFCLRWNDFHTNITSAFSDIRDDDEFLDVTLVSNSLLIYLGSR